MVLTKASSSVDGHQSDLMTSARAFSAEENSETSKPELRKKTLFNPSQDDSLAVAHSAQRDSSDYTSSTMAQQNASPREERAAPFVGTPHQHTPMVEAARSRAAVRDSAASAKADSFGAATSTISESAGRNPQDVFVTRPRAGSSVSQVAEHTPHDQFMTRSQAETDRLVAQRALDREEKKSLDRKDCANEPSHALRPARTASELMAQFEHERRHRDAEDDAADLTMTLRRDETVRVVEESLQRAVGAPSAREMRADLDDADAGHAHDEEKRMRVEMFPSNRAGAADADEGLEATPRTEDRENEVNAAKTTTPATQLAVHDSSDKPLVERHPHPPVGRHERSAVGAWFSALGHLFRSDEPAKIVTKSERAMQETHAREMEREKAHERELELELEKVRQYDRQHERELLIERTEEQPMQRDLGALISPVSPAYHEAALARPADSDIRCALSLVYE